MANASIVVKIKKVATLDSALAVFEILYSHFRLLRPDHPNGKDIFTQFMSQSFIFPIILFVLIAVQGIMAIRLYGATLLNRDHVDSALKRCSWWRRCSIFFLILSCLDIFVIIFLLAFDAYKRPATIALLTIFNITSMIFRIVGFRLVGQFMDFLSGHEHAPSGVLAVVVTSDCEPHDDTPCNESHVQQVNNL